MTLPDRLRRKVFERDNFICQRKGCGAREKLAVHHIIPRKMGGTNALDNLMTVCMNCHLIVEKYGNIEDLDSLEVIPKPSDKRETAGKAYLPKSWIGKKVIARLA